MTKIKLPECRAYTELMNLLPVCGKTNKQIAKDTGVPYHYIRALSIGEIPNPSIRRTETLLDYMRGQIAIKQ
jgi:hypothetical protein